MVELCDFYIKAAEAGHFKPRACSIIKELRCGEMGYVYVSVNPPIDDDYYKSESASTHLLLRVRGRTIWPKPKDPNIRLTNIKESQYPVHVFVGAIDPDSIPESGIISESDMKIIDFALLYRTYADALKSL